MRNSSKGCIMENEFLTFEATEVELIGDVIEFDEQVQRGEKVRFYTLNEQVTDAFEQMIPKGRTTRKQIEKLDKEVDRIRDLYSTYVTPTTEGYEVNVPKGLRSFPWIHPVYTNSEVSRYSYDDQWTPLFSPTSIRQPNGYVRMLTGLPSPYIAQQGTPYPIDTVTEFVDSDGKGPQRILPRFVMNQTRRHEDGRIDVMNKPVDGTADPAEFKGYWLEKRSIRIPNPSPDHFFLESNDERFIPSNQPLSDVIPGIEAVMEHGVPDTQDPYGEGLKFLKVYDVSLDMIPWELWKRRFPKKEIIDTMPAPIELPFVEPKTTPPSANVVEEYGNPYFPGYAVRKWFMSQEDGGQLVVKMIQSLSGNAGTVDMLPLSELGELRFPTVDDEQCMLTGVSFNDFTLHGVIRQLEVYERGKFIGYERKCLPTDIIQQERHQIGYRNREQWKPSTPDDMLKLHRTILKFFRKLPPPRSTQVYERYLARSSSQLREQIVAVLKDDDRVPEDKLKAIQLLTRDAPHSNKIVTDSEGLFVVCDHTLAILSGDMATDRLGFYDTWTVRVDGSRVCKVCGEEVNKDVLVHQEDFSEEGRALKHADALETATFHGESTLTFTTKLRSLQGLFNLTEPADSTLFLLISLLQVLPSQEQLVPVLQAARAMADPLRSRDRDGKARGMIGLAATALLLQIHLPTLVPRRSFGSVPIKMDGFPRDTDVEKAPTVIDSLMMVLRKTFEAYPTSFKGPSVAVMRGVLSEASSIRKGVISILRRLMPGFTSALTRAKSELTMNPPLPTRVGLIPVRLPPETLGTITSFAPCGNPRTVWADSKPPLLSQPVVPLDKVRPRPTTIPLRTTVIQPHTLNLPDVKDIQRRVRITSVARTEGDSWRTNLMIAQRLNDVFHLKLDFSSLDVTQKPSLLRDIAEGFVKEVTSSILKDPVKRRAYEELREKDLTLFSLLYPLKDAKSETNSARAKERHIFTDRLREMTDSERQITKDLLDRGMAPFIITNVDRDIIAAQIERELGGLEEEDIGVGAPRDAPEDDERNVDEGDYGDHLAQGNRDRDQYTEEIDQEGPI